MFEEQNPRKYYPFLDGFRGIAVLWVMLHHAQYFFKLQPFLERVCPWLTRVCHLGMLGVDMFFIISGFLITGLLGEDLKAEKVNLKRFYLRRCFKILPQYLFVIVVGVLFVWGGTPETIDPMTIASYFFFLQNYGQQVPTLAHTWSLAIEEHFYLFYPLVIGMVCSATKNVAVRRRQLAVFCAVAIGLISFQRYITLLPPGPDYEYFFQRPIFRTDALLFGCLLKLFEPYYAHSNQIFWRRIALYVSVVGYLIYGSFFIMGIFMKQWYFYNLSYLAPACLIFAAYHGWDTLVQNPRLRWVGRNSYGIYLWHYLMIFPVLSRLPEHATPGIRIGFVVLYFVISIVAGVLSTLTIERHFLELRKKFVH